jgi:hypothetical protein
VLNRTERRRAWPALIALLLAGCAMSSGTTGATPAQPTTAAPRTLTHAHAKPAARTAAHSRPVAHPRPVAGTSAAATARAELAGLAVHADGSLAGYSRTLFGGDWAYSDGCNTRDRILTRDLTDVTYRAYTCIPVAGVLRDPYSGAVIDFSKSRPMQVQIDHVVAVANAWETGAAGWQRAERIAFYNDPTELLAVSGVLNDEKGDADAAGWLPPNVSFDCSYVERQVAVKAKYRLWVTPAERSAMSRTLRGC